jgi:protein gp37
MGHDSQVEYVDDSFCACHRCSKKSAGCRMCFAADLARRWGHDDLWRRHSPRRVVAESTWRDPLKWNEQARREGRRRRILFRLIEHIPWLIWVLFTKRPENVGMIPWDGTWPDNAWLVTSAVMSISRLDHGSGLLLCGMDMSGWPVLTDGFHFAPETTRRSAARSPERLVLAA